MSCIFKRTMCFIIWAMICSQAIAEKVEIFSDLNHEEALAKSVEEDKLLVIDFTASWCPPCQMMEETTWVDQVTVDWFAENAVVVQVDIDEQRDIAEKHQVQSIPTFVVYREGKKFDRMSGLLTTKELIGWLESVKEGGRQIDLIFKKAGPRVDQKGYVNLDVRVKLTEAYIKVDMNTEAMDELLWMWQYIIKEHPDWLVNYTEWLSYWVKDIAGKDEATKKLVVAQRDLVEERLKSSDDAGRSWDDIEFWIYLNNAIGETKNIVGWFDRIREHESFDYAVGRFSDEIGYALYQEERWGDLAATCLDPVSEMRSIIRENNPLELLRLPEDKRAEHGKHLNHEIRHGGGYLYAVCLAGGKEEQALEVAMCLIGRLDDEQTRRYLVRAAVEFGSPQARKEQLMWLDEITQPNEDDQVLRAKVTELLEK